MAVCEFVMQNILFPIWAVLVCLIMLVMIVAIVLMCIRWIVSIWKS